MTAILFGSISTLADTSELQRRAFNDAFAEHGLDWSWDREAYRALLDRNGGAARVASYAQERGEEVDAGAVHATKSRRFQQLLREDGVAARPGVAETIREAHDRGVKVGVVTTTSTDNLDTLLDALAASIDRAHLDVVLDRSDVTDPKPAPDVYAAALQRLDLPATRCVAIEDNLGGVTAASAAGVACVAFPNDNTATHDFAAATDRVEQVGLDALLTHLEPVG